MIYYIEDVDLGKVFIRVNSRAKSVIARKRDGHIHLTVPSYSTEREIRTALAQLKPKLLSIKPTVRKVIDENFSLHTYSFDVAISRNKLSKIYLTLNDGLLQITVPSSIDIYRNETQEQLRNFIERALRHEAKRIFPPYVARLAELHRFRFSDVKINKSKSRWGSCNSKKVINLSYFCLLLPPHLLELIILHELCHTREMNHSERFWQELDSVTQNKAKELTKELKQFSTTF